MIDVRSASERPPRSAIAYGCGSLASLLSPAPPVDQPADSPAVAAFKANHTKEAIAAFKRGPLDPALLKRAEEVIHTALECGITLFDHADIYAFGRAEEVFGHVLAKNPRLRENLVIQSKCGVRFAGDLFAPEPGDPHHLDLSTAHILASVDGSLQRLGIEYLDTLLLHRPDALVEPEEIAKAFDALHSAGKVRYFGVSNHTTAQIALLQNYLDQRIVVNQLHISLAYPHVITDGLDATEDDATRLIAGYTGSANVLDYCRLHDIEVQAAAPFKGALLGAPSLLAPATGEDKRTLPLDRIAKEKGLTRAAIMIAWLIRHPARIVPVIGPTKPAHISEACAGRSVKLTRAEWYELLAAAQDVSSLRLLGLSLPEGW